MWKSLPTNILSNFLLPWVYWQQQADKTRNPSLKSCYQQATQQAQTRLTQNPFSVDINPELFQFWLSWSQHQCKTFERTSSAVEGFNGYLSRLHQARRGFSAQSLAALTGL